MIYRWTGTLWLITVTHMWGNTLDFLLKWVVSIYLNLYWILERLKHRFVRKSVRTSILFSTVKGLELRERPLITGRGGVWKKGGGSRFHTWSDGEDHEISLPPGGGSWNLKKQCLENSIRTLTIRCINQKISALRAFGWFIVEFIMINRQ